MFPINQNGAHPVSFLLIGPAALMEVGLAVSDGSIVRVTFLQGWVNEMICPRCQTHELEPGEDVCLDCYISETRAEPNN